MKSKRPAPSKMDYRARVHKLELLLDFGRRISTEKTLDSLLGLLANEVKTTLEADRCTIFILDRKKKILWSKVAHGTADIISVPWDKGIAGQAVLSGKLINIKDAYNDKRFNREVDKKTGYRTHSMLTSPMKNLHKKVVGVFQVLNKLNMKPFDKEDEDILTILASQAAVAVENTQLYEQVQHASIDTIFRLSAAAEYKDRDTAYHLFRMSRYTALIAKSMGFSKDYCEMMRLASPMHDIGKLGVPDAILLKPGKLDEKEWIEMRKHPLHGAEILKDSDNELLQLSETIALTHHEKFDGTGYPKGLKGGAIPIEGRIVALADVFDALTSKRVYKEKFSLEDTLKIIRDGSGKHFDPAVVKSFEKVLPGIKEIMERYSEQNEDLEHELPKDSPANISTHLH